jgi:polyisoprenoid-binding protein YceI
MGVNGMATTRQETDPRLPAKLADGSLAGVWKLEPSQSSVSLRSRSMWGLLPVKGAFGRVSGDGVVSPRGHATGTISVATASVDTKNNKRDTHLRSADFFDSENYPYIVFTVGAMTLTDGGVTIAGTLRVRDSTQALDLPARVFAPSDDVVHLDAEVVIDRSDFGLTWNQIGMASMKNTIAIHAVFTRPMS